MKHSLPTQTLVVLLTGLIAVASAPVHAASSGSITISGAILAVNDVTVTSQTGYNSLDLVTGATDQTVAVVNEKNNSLLGYTVTLASANALLGQARLKGANVLNVTGTVNYSIKYGTAGSEAAVTLNVITGSATVTDAIAATPAAGVDKNLKITFSGTTGLQADTYSDTLTLTIAAK